MDANVFEILKAVCYIVGIVLSVWVVPALKKAINSWVDANISKEQIKEIKTAIAAAYQLLSQDPADNEKKYNLVVNYIIQLSVEKGWNISPEQLKILIEGLYSQFKQNGNKFIEE